MKKLNLITEFDEFYKGSDLQKIVKSKPLPIKYTIDGFDFYFYNADLFGLFNWKIKKEGLTTNDFINDYKNGFKSGLLHLKELEKIKLKDLKSKDLREGTILQLKNILHKREFKFGSKGLLDLVFNKVPLIFTEKNIFDYGYWNGIIYSIDDIIEKAGLTLDELKTSEPQQNDKPKPELTINQIALKYVYSEIQITRENGNKIAKEYGYNSGEKLFQRFTYFSSPTNRKGKPNLCTPKKLDNKIKLIESIIELLPTDKQERAKDEVSILKKIYEAEYQ